MDNNPYSTPDSEVAAVLEPGQCHPPRRVPVGNGIQWIADGFGHFKKDPGIWIVICIVGFVILMALSIIPVVAQLSQFTVAIWVGGLMLGCHAQDSDEPLTINHLFAGFSNNMGPLLVVSVIIVIASLAILAVIVMAIAGVYGMSIFLGDTSQLFTEEFVMVILIGLLVYMAAIIPIIALGWFSPALIVLNNVPVFTAMAMSFKACFINVVPFFIYGLVLSVLFVIGMIPLLLGLLVVMPVFYGSLYRSYKDIFID
ncbi:Uncharacterized membrane protein [Alteromonadaceae bacterium Bs31]|nr:Uncharacterized membrane protein [Alteromonadaceae bacterium Bs31]SMF58574.1 Uncharacterized membrane protein [Alteromonadaceae bacterium Bs31]